MKNKMKKNFKRILMVSACVLVVTFVFGIINVFSQEHGEGDYCLGFSIDENPRNFPLASVTINGYRWNSENDRFYNNENQWTIVILAGKDAQNEFPFVSTAGGLVVDDPNDPEYPGYGTYTAIPNPDDDPNVDGDEYKFTITLDTWAYTGNPNAEPPTCASYGVSIYDGPPIEAPSEIVSSNVSITISGDELEYHYDSEHLDEADVAYFKFDINGGTDEVRLVPFTFRNAQYTYNDGVPPKNVSSVTTKEPIHYEYPYNGSGTVEFCVNGGGTDEYTHIYINGVDYGNQAPHTKVEHFETMDGWAQKFCIHDVPYSDTYVVSVTGENTAIENRIPGFGWNYLSADRSNISPEEEGNFAHGRLEFVSATYTVDGNETITINNASDFDNYRYHGTGQIFQWRDGNKQYPEENRREAWGEAQLPYGTTLTVRIVPDEGYQLTALSTSPNGFQATETPGVYTITLNDSNFSYNGDNNIFDLNPTFTQVGAEVRAGSVNVRSGVIETNQAVENGSLKLEVNDTVSMSPERLESFENKAEEEGYEIENYLDISLYNSIYKGGKKDNNNNYLSWDTEVNNLSEDARITLELEQNMEGKEITLIHERRDGDNYTYEVIPVNYNSQTNSIEFETRSFSDYAVAVRNITSGEEPKEKVTVEFNTTGGSAIEPVEIEKGSTVTKPADPTNGDKVFSGWFEDEECERPFNFDSTINENITLYAKWLEPENVEDYEIPDENGNVILFTEEKDHTFHLFITDYLTYSKEEVMSAASISSEDYDMVFGSLKNATKKYGTLLSFYEIEVKDEDDRTLEQGPFTIKIKITDKMKKYNTFKLFYVNDEFGVESPITLKKEGNYLVGTLDHLSLYTLVGNNDSNIPKTGDSITIWVSLFIISIIGILLTIFISKKLTTQKAHN